MFPPVDPVIESFFDPTGLSASSGTSSPSSSLPEAKAPLRVNFALATTLRQIKGICGHRVPQDASPAGLTLIAVVDWSSELLQDMILPAPSSAIFTKAASCSTAQCRPERCNDGGLLVHALVIPASRGHWCGPTTVADPNDPGAAKITHGILVPCHRSSSSLLTSPEAIGRPTNARRHVNGALTRYCVHRRALFAFQDLRKVDLANH
ncbi:hypothetical protein DL93DRAFT_2234028 [Clavulina sp. PMI_390]|nr:hypothetical protein DL93DRAFT_2234028 [Clavulina sp. PMI_390]